MYIERLTQKGDDGSHRQANWLELFFDLAFVICFSTLSHHLISHPSIGSVFVFLAFLVPIWWIWNQFTWYASQFDNGDALFRAFMIAAVGATLLLVEGLHEFERGHDEHFIGAYILIHCVLALGWIRAYRDVKEVRPYSKYKLIGILLGLAFWGASPFFAAPVRYGLWGIGIALQLALPMYAWGTVKNTISVHHHHLAERHGLFTIIVLGESLISLVNGVSQAGLVEAAPRALLSFIVIISVWMIYFDWRFAPVSVKSVPRVFAMNYGHLPVYAGLGLLAAGIGLTLKANAADTFRMGSAIMCSGASLFLFALSIMNLISGADEQPRKVYAQLASAILFAALILVPGGEYPIVMLSIAAGLLFITASFGRGGAPAH